MGVMQGPMALADIGAAGRGGATFKPPQFCHCRKSVGIVRSDVGSEENDMRWVAAGVEAGIIHLDIVEERLGTTRNLLKGDLKKIKSSIRAIRE